MPNSATARIRPNLKVVPQALATRVRFLREQADRDVLVLGTHFATPTAGRVVSDGAAWRFVAD